MAVPCVLVRPSRIPRWISKILFALGSYEFLAILEGKLERPHFLKVQSGKITVCVELLIKNDKDRIQVLK